MEKIKEYVRLLVKNEYEDEIVSFVVEEMIDRALSYMNRKQLPIPLERVIAKAASNYLKKWSREQKGEIYEVSSASDNGQSISYQSKLITYMSTQEDEGILEGITEQLKCYRLAKVVGEDEITRRYEG